MRMDSQIVLWYVVHPSTLYYSGTPFKNFGTPFTVNQIGGFFHPSQMLYRFTL